MLGKVEGLKPCQETVNGKKNSSLLLTFPFFVKKMIVLVHIVFS